MAIGLDAKGLTTCLLAANSWVIGDLMLDQRRIGTAVPIARDRQLDRAVGRQHGLGAAAVAMVAGCGLAVGAQIHTTIAASTTFCAGASGHQSQARSDRLRAGVHQPGVHGWALSHGIQHILIQPGRPMQNGYIESFNGRFRDEYLNDHWFQTLHQARATITAWRRDYNEVRPHGSIGRIPPDRFAGLQRRLITEAVQHHDTNDIH